MVISVRRPHFIDYLREEAPFYRVNLGRGWLMSFYLSPKLCWRLAGISFYSPCSSRHQLYCLLLVCKVGEVLRIDT